MTAATQRATAVRANPSAPAGRSKDVTDRRRSKVSYGILIALLIAVLLFLAPFLVITVNAFKAPADLAAHGPLSLPHGWHFSTITHFWSQVDFGGVLLNSLEISFVVAVLGVGLSLLNAYALGIGRVRGRVVFLVFFLNNL